MTTRPTLIGSHYSPWTLRARWALDHHRVAYRYREHMIMLGELGLRWHRGLRRSGPVTVPMLVEDGGVYDDSIAIMRRADAIGGGVSLDAASDAVAQLAADLDPALHAMRVRVTRRTLNDPEALREAMAGVTPAALTDWARPVAAQGARFIARKYGFDPDEQDEPLEAVHAGLTLLRERIGEGPYVGDRFSALDILAATALNGVEPLDELATLPPATRRVWRHEGLAEQYADLLEWRRGLWAAHAPGRRAPAAGPTRGRSTAA